MLEWVRWVRLWFLVSIGRLLRLYSAVVCSISIVGVVSVNLSPFWPRIFFLQSGLLPLAFSFQ